MNTTEQVQEPVQSPDARRWTRTSWLMLPLLVPSGVLAFVAAVVLLGTADLEGSEPMSEQGLVGWLAVLLGLVIWPLPAYFGVWLNAGYPPRPGLLSHHRHGAQRCRDRRDLAAVHRDHGQPVVAKGPLRPPR